MVYLGDDAKDDTEEKDDDYGAVEKVVDSGLEQLQKPCKRIRTSGGGGEREGLSPKSKPRTFTDIAGHLGVSTEMSGTPGTEGGAAERDIEPV